MANLGKKLLIVGVLACFVFAGLAGYGDVREVSGRMASFPFPSLLLAVGLALLNYLLRFLRWAYYLKILAVSVPLRLSILIFLTGLAMTITPGKLGELLKCYLLRDQAGIPVSTSAPAVLMERITDLVAIGVMALVGLALLPAFVSAILVAVVAGLVLVAYFSTARQDERVLDLPIIRRWRADIVEAREGVRTLSRPVPLLVASILGLAAWLSEGVALWVVMEGLGADLGFLISLPIYAGSLLAGAVTTLPGGLVGTEGAMVTLLQQMGAGRDAAAAGTLIVRLVTLWLAVLVGFAAFGWLQWSGVRRRYPKEEGGGAHESGLPEAGGGQGRG
ncbi:MAG: flippase-like domain-containing protein [Chloroflexi bacterium]|nr:flippase-like domain-containing protein [Chloroflexota bacterium]